jgi:hypothetical protein
MRRRRFALSALAALLATLAAAGPAQAGNGVVTRSGTTISVDFSGTLDGDSFHVLTTGSTLELSENASGTMTDMVPGADCTQFAPDRVDCPIGSATRLLVDLGPGDDFAEIQTFSPQVQLELDGGTGNEPEILGSSGDDIIDGGPGDDFIFGRGGDDQMQGGEGDDELIGGSETDDISGGPGFDLVDVSGVAAVTISLDDLPGDGAAGENDNVHSDVEDVEATGGNDVITGSALGNRLRGLGGDDRIDGAGGADLIEAGDGADQVNSFDGLAELIDCGGGVDSVIADDIDVTDGCESEHRSTALQTDVDGDGAARPVDCDDGDAAVRPGAPEIRDDGVDQNCDGADATDLDRDRDGVPRPIDCDDGNPAARPGGRERRGNRIDEDCNGRAEPFALVTNGVTNAWVTQGASTRNLRLGVRDVRRRMTVELRCRGGGCPFAKKVRKVKRRKRLLDLHPLLAGAVLRPGAVLEVRIRRPQAIGKVVRYSVRSGAVPRSRALCLPPGKKRPREC